MYIYIHTCRGRRSRSEGCDGPADPFHQEKSCFLSGKTFGGQIVAKPY